ncbi:hypothetical protein GURKE_03200 [Brevundimonas phage vB_BpoS-Gurke]|uniref:Uncharacterized protein n=1 Tax=Brevundimonas phage vB_BpoS-Gurke TaxID=2948599 RepID=A0A9E7N4G0_9CAUD|nr:hypothetical protein GURKE_03200 [Brevundimonas phage vB_BpoS-Gurke]
MPTPTELTFDPELLRRFALQAYDIGADGAEDVELIVDLPQKPEIRKTVSLAGLFILAVMTLDEDGTISRRMDELLKTGPISEIDACNRITTLLDQTQS